MSDERDPLIQSLFDRAQEDMPGDDFAGMIMSRIDRQRRRKMMGWLLLYATLLLCAVLLAPALTAAFAAVSSILPASLIEADERLIAQILSPVNSVAALLAFSAFLAYWLYRMIFR